MITWVQLESQSIEGYLTLLSGAGPERNHVGKDVLYYYLTILLAALPTLCVTLVCSGPAVSGEGVALFWLAAFSSQKFSVSWRCRHASLTYTDSQREVCRFSLYSQDRGDNLITKHFETSTVFSMLKTTSKSFRGKKKANHFFIYISSSY